MSFVKKEKNKCNESGKFFAVHKEQGHSMLITAF